MESRSWRVQGTALLGGMMLGCVLLVGVAAHAADGFKQPTKEELEMKTLPGYPGAAAVVLYREEITYDDRHVTEHYERIKILTEEGKKYANVELGIVTANNVNSYFGDDKSLADIQARTIHADGTVIPFTGKPYTKVIEKSQDSEFGFKVQQKIFTLPDVEAGSIIEYRYETLVNARLFEPPDWYIQGELYVRLAHYQWYPTLVDLEGGKNGAMINSIAMFTQLPEGVKVSQTHLPPKSSLVGPQQIYKVDVKDVPPAPHEEYMAPASSVSYRVLFSYTEYLTALDYWKYEGGFWSKRENEIANPNGELKDATQKVIAGAATQDEKLRKIYAEVMSLENTRFTRQHQDREEQAVGAGKVNNAADVLSHKRGSPEQLTELFVGMARAAGLKAYLMAVTNRSERIFAPSWLHIGQLTDRVAIVNVGGKDVFFDPGEQYCAYGHLAWQHTFVGGVRQTDGGTEIYTTPGEGYQSNKTARVANLEMDEHGVVSGKVTLTYTGAGALRWRQLAAGGDHESLNHGLTKSLEGMLAKGLSVDLAGIENLDDYEQPLKVTYDVKGAPGTATQKRVVIPADLFVAGERATFPDEKRTKDVYFPYPQMVQDAVRIALPKQLVAEGAPESAKFELPKRAMYTMSVAVATDSVTTRRTYMFADIVVPEKEYPALSTFYRQFESKDQESLVLKAGE